MDASHADREPPRLKVLLSELDMRFIELLSMRMDNQATTNGDIRIKFICHHPQAKFVQPRFVKFEDMMVVPTDEGTTAANGFGPARDL